jgi:ComF family protein
LPLGNPGDPRCSRCLRRAPVWDALFAPFRYDPPLDRLVHRFKYQGHLDAARLLGELMVAAVTTARIPRPDYLVPVPLHPRRLRERGFNQALEAARPLAGALGLPLLPGAAERVRPTVSQAGLSARMRRHNLRGAFASAEAPPGSHIAIIDDVVTTGATVAALTKTLKEAGVARVDVWALARAVVPF